MCRRRVLSVVLTLVGALAVAAAVAVAAAPEKITRSGVGRVELKATYTSLHAKRLVGRIHKGCELAGPRARAANLKAPLKGSVDFTMTSPRKVTDITVRGGATARGVGIGATIAQIRARFPRAHVDHSTESTFGTTRVAVPKNGGGRIEFAVDVHTHKTVLIGVPFIATCD
jgi:hypothetical protein